MRRQNIWEYSGDPYAGTQLAGWFDLDAATQYPDDVRQDVAFNDISLITGSQWDRESLYLTSGGRWVRQQWSMRAGDAETWEYIGVEAAREWLIRSDYDSAAIEKATGDPLPPEMGRPEIGPQVKVRLPADVLARVDAAAAAAGQTRSAWLRAVIEVEVGNGETRPSQ